jgi:hypothetical protein
MNVGSATSIHRLKPADIPLMSELLTLFGKAFNEEKIYTASRPSAAYHQNSSRATRSSPSPR